MSDTRHFFTSVPNYGVPSEDTFTSSSASSWVPSSFTQTTLISVTQFAKVAGVTAQAVRKMIAEQRIRFVRSGKQYSIPKEELDGYISRKS